MMSRISRSARPARAVLPLAGACGALALLAACSLTDEPPGGQRPDPVTGTATAAPSGHAPADSDPDAAEATTTPTAAGGPAPEDVDLATLTVTWPCGYAFELSDPDRSATLVLQWLEPEAALPATVTLPDPAWQGELLLGEGLGGGTCTPGVEPAGVTAAWEVVGGAIVFAGPGDEARGTGGPVRVRLSAVTVRAPDGTVLELPNQELTHTGWGQTYD